MACPTSQQIEAMMTQSAATGVPLSTDMQTCYEQWTGFPNEYAAQNDGASPHIQIAQQNPASLTTPQPGTVPMDPNKTGLIAQILGVLGKGATAYQKYQLETALAEAKANGRPIYVPPSLIADATTPSAASDIPWTEISIGGAVLVGVIVLVVLAARSK